MTEHPLISFLRARLDEDEQVAHGGDGRSPDMTLRLDDDLRWVSVTPARVLREVEAKRRMIAECEATIRQGVSVGLAETMLAMLAEPYQDHPDYPKDQP